MTSDPNKEAVPPAEILTTPDVGGALVGGASLTAESFLGIIVAAAERDEA